MNWLLKIAGRDDFLAGLGASPEIIDYVMQQDDQDYAHFLTNQFRTNPQLTLNDLQALRMPIKESPYLPLEEENAELLIQRWPNEKRHLASAFRQWALVEMRKHRRPQDDVLQGPTYDTSAIVILNQPFASLSGLMEYVFRPIKDWYIATESEIASYSLETAAAATKQWQEAQRGEGDEVYDGTDQVVFSWDKGKFAGWSVKRILSQNNALVEGGFMNHCVGDCEYDEGYDTQEAAGIFRDPYMGAHVELFSLRDPKDRPHVTIELGAETWIGEGGDTQAIYQIYGPGNSEPKSEYKHLISDWFDSHQKATGNKLTWGDDDSVDINSLKYEHPRSLPDRANELFYEGDSYGIMPNLTGADIEYLYDTIMGVVTHDNRTYEVGSGDLGCAEWLINFAWDADKQWMQELCGNIDAKDFAKGSRVAWLEIKSDKNSESFWDYYEPHAPMPDEDDYETTEEYQEAYDEWEKEDSDAQDWHMSHYLPYAFDNHMMKVLYQELQKKDPSYAEIKQKCVKPEPQKPVDNAQPAQYNTQG